MEPDTRPGDTQPTISNQKGPSLMIYQHQQSVYEQLILTARAFFKGDWRDLPVRPRFNRFVTGPTGVGKTKIVRSAAEKVGVPLFELSASNWMPLGCSERGARPTWLDIADFCLANERGIFFLDEADKLGESSSWLAHIRVEMFLLLDQCVPQNLQIKSPDDDDDNDDRGAREARKQTVAERLRDGMLIVGAGAFQSLWEHRTRQACGFHALPAGDTPTLAHREMHQSIPPEVANRFASPILQLNPLEKADYREMVGHVGGQLTDDFTSRFTALAEARIESAVANQTGCRWIEELMLALVQEKVSLDDGTPSPTNLPRPNRSPRPAPELDLDSSY